MIATNVWFWVGFVAFVLAMLALDLGVFNRRPHVVRPKEAATWTAVWVGLALLFAAGLAYFAAPQTALTFLTGYLIEESLSIDNIFVIVLIFQYFAVPAQYQHRVLFWGILGALVMRGIMIGAVNGSHDTTLASVLDGLSNTGCMKMIDAISSIITGVAACCTSS